MPGPFILVLSSRLLQPGGSGESGKEHGIWLLGMKPLGDGNGAGRWGGSGVPLRVPWSPGVPCPLHGSARQAAFPHPRRKAVEATQVLFPGVVGSRSTPLPMGA